MQFGALTLFLCIKALREPGRARWLVAASVAAGLGCGTKYPGGLLLVPVLLAALFTTPREPKRLLRTAVTLGLVFAATYLVTTPGTLLDTQAFQRDLAFELKHYRTDGHGVYSVTPGLEHAQSMLAYLSTQLFSPHFAYSVFLSLFVLVGAVVMWREDRRYALLLILFPVLYLAYMSSMRALIVRNLLVLVPFLAVLAARGACWSLAALPGALWPKRCGLAFAGLLVVVNGAFLARAAATITGDDPDRFLRAFSEHVADRPDERFFLSPRLRSALAGLDPLPLLSNVIEHAEEPSDHVGLYMEECADSTSWKTLNSGIDVFGTLEVNFSHYPTWGGRTRILLMTLETARAQGIPMFRHE
jgi:4-amino-4-deoxy-L-arabinose transferase-like glycosyltransferase